MDNDVPVLNPGRRSAALQGMIVNPGATPEVLRRLLRRSRHTAEEIAAGSPRLDAGLAEQLLALDDLAVDAALAANPALPEPVRQLLADHPDPEVRAAVPHDGLPEELLARLAADAEPEVRAAVAHCAAPADVQRLLAGDPEPEVRAVLALRPELPEDVARRLLADPDPGIRETACRAERPVPADLHGQLLADPATRPWIVPHLALTPGLAAELAHDPDPAVRAKLAERPDVPAELHGLLEQDRHGIVRHAVLFSRWLGDQRRGELLAEVTAGSEADDEHAGVTDFMIRMSGPTSTAHWLHEADVAESLRHLDSPLPQLRRAAALVAGPRHPEVAEYAGRHEDPCVRSLGQPGGGYAESLHLSPPPRELLRLPRTASAELAASEHWEARAFTAGAAGLPAEWLDRLAADPEPRVRASAAVNPDLPLPRLAALLDDRSLYVAEAAGASPALPVAWMEALLAAEGL